MHSRQRGAAHVPILFFVLTLLLAIGALAFGWVQLNRATLAEGNEAVAKEHLAAAKQLNLLHTHYVEDLGNVFKVPGKYTGRPASINEYGNQALDKIPGTTDPALLKQKLDQAAAQLGVPSFSGIENLLGAVNTSFEEKNARIKELEGEVSKRDEDKRVLEASFVTAGKSHSDEQKKLQDVINQTLSDRNNQLANKDSSLKTAEQALRDKNDELNAAKEAAANEKKAITAEMVKLRAHTAAMAGKMNLINPPDVADGKIIAARNNVAAAWINLGRKDMLQPGTIFRIKNPKSETVKAYATVTRVEQERAEVTLSGVVDPLNDAVRENDVLFNELYSPGVSRNIYLMGRFSYPYNKGDVEKLLTSLGNKVHSKMDPTVDLVIIGFDPTNEGNDGFQAVTETAEYKDATNWGVEFAQLHKIRDLIKL